VNLTVGGRYYDVSSDNSTVADGLFNGGPSVNGAASSATGVVGKANLSWKPSPQTLFYAQVAQGFRPGFGTDQLPGACAADAIARGLDPNASEVTPDKVVDYEVGAKGTLFGGRVRGGAAFYRNDWRDIQLAVFLPCGFKQSANAGDVVIYGAELEGAVSLTDSLEVGGALSYIHDRFTHTLAGTDAQVGDPILNVPTWSASGYAQYRFPAFGMDGLARLDLQYTGDALLFYDRVAASAPAPLQFRERPSLTLVNARVQVSSPDWTFAVFGRNLTNEEAITGFAESISANIPYRPRFAVNTPRVLGIEITRRF
jgi:outer membrane receptor protein involved in Fe transport